MRDHRDRTTAAHPARRAGFGLAVLWLATFGASTATGTDSRQAGDPLRELNAAFRDIYRHARAETLAGLGPIVHVRGDGLTLIQGDRRIEAEVIPPIYHDLKAVSHLPLAIDLALSSPPSN